LTLGQKFALNWRDDANGSKAQGREAPCRFSRKLRRRFEP